MPARNDHPDARPRRGLSRRRFIEGTAGVGAVLTLGRLAGAAESGAKPPVPAAAALAKMIRSREISSLEAVRACLARIEALNPSLNALVTVCRERALAEAAEADALLASGKTEGPLHGVPFTVSDAFDTENVRSTAGTLGRQSLVPARDAAVVARARAAGAILLGKSNSSELALTSFAGITSNLVAGTTHNPYNRSRGMGSGAGSGGSGVSVAIGGGSFDIAGDDGGAIREVAAMNGVVGFKPTLGRLPRTGHVLGYGGAFDNFVEVGLLTRSVEDLSLLLPILCGPDGSDATLAPIPLPNIAGVNLGALRVAHWNATPGTNQEAADAVARCVTLLGELGARITAETPPKLEEFSALQARYRGGDGRAHVRRLLQRLGTERTSPQLALQGEIIPSPQLSQACEELDRIRSEQLAWSGTRDLVILPAGIPGPAGWPTGILRCGTSASGLPLSVQLLARPWREDLLLAAMVHLEKPLGGYQTPTLAGGVA
jgi:amidase